MEYTKLGNTGMDVSRLWLGCLGFGGASRWIHTWVFNAENSRPIIKHALDLGIKFFDTADVYSIGTSEEILGRLLKDVALCTPTFLEHGPGMLPDHGSEETKQMLAGGATAFPDSRVTVEDMIAEGDKVAVRLRVHATHQGDFMGLPPSGKALSYTFMDIIRFEQGKIAEIWAEADMLGMLQQLGAIPTSGQATPQT